MLRLFPASRLLVDRDFLFLWATFEVLALIEVADVVREKFYELVALFSMLLQVCGD